MRKVLVLTMLVGLAVAGSAAAQAAQGAAGEVSTTPEVAAAIEAADGLMKSEQFAEAAAGYEKVLAAHPESQVLRLSLSRAYYGNGDLEKAVGLLTEIHTAEPGNAAAAALLASILAEGGKVAEARKLLEPLAAESLTDSTEIINVGLIFMNKNQAKDAFWYFDKAVKAAPAWPPAYYYRAQASLQLGKVDAGKADLKKVIELAPESDDGKDAKELLDELSAGA
jgi:predicted Zn-dependent protease